MRRTRYLSKKAAAVFMSFVMIVTGFVLPVSAAPITAFADEDVPRG